MLQRAIDAQPRKNIQLNANIPPVHHVTQAESGEEAYRKRALLSSSAPPDKTGYTDPSQEEPDEETHIIVITNMLSPHEINSHFKNQVLKECTKYGQISDYVFHLVPQSLPVPEEMRVRIFIEYLTVPSASNGKK
jgi:hypothetical protein